MRTLSIFHRTVFFSETSLRNTVFQINSYFFPVSRFIHNFIHKHNPNEKFDKYEQYEPYV